VFVPDETFIEAEKRVDAPSELVSVHDVHVPKACSMCVISERRTYERIFDSADYRAWPGATCPEGILRHSGEELDRKVRVSDPPLEVP
jgi:hypothetical protein